MLSFSFLTGITTPVSPRHDGIQGPRTLAVEVAVLVASSGSRKSPAKLPPWELRRLREWKRREATCLFPAHGLGVSLPLGSQAPQCHGGSDAAGRPRPSGELVGSADPSWICPGRSGCLAAGGSGVNSAGVTRSVPRVSSLGGLAGLLFTSEAKAHIGDRGPCWRPRSTSEAKVHVRGQSPRPRQRPRPTSEAKTHVRG